MFMGSLVGRLAAQEVIHVKFFAGAGEQGAPLSVMGSPVGDMIDHDLASLPGNQVKVDIVYTPAVPCVLAVTTYVPEKSP